MTTPAGVVLAGGASSRMGRDKALVDVDGRPMILHVADALGDGGCAPVWCQGGDAVALGRLGFDVVPDVAAGGGSGRPGPVAAIATALATAPSIAACGSSTVVIAACDLPDLTGDLVRSLVRVSVGGGVVAVAASGGRRHLVAAWPIAVSAELVRVIARGVGSYSAALAELGAVDVAVPDRQVHNVNLPADLLGRGPAQR